jgi:hypothetical protein
VPEYEVVDEVNQSDLVIEASSLVRAVPMKETSSFYDIGYRTKKVLLSNL